MKDFKAFNGERLRAARIYRGKTVAELANELDLKRQTISLYENGKLNNPGLENIRKMSQVLSFPMDFFLESENKTVSIAPSTYFRSQLTTNQKYRTEQSLKIRFICKIYAYINEYIEFPDLNIPAYEVYNSPDEAAYVLRQQWGLSDKPIDNLIYIAEQNGLILTSYNTSTNAIDAFSQSLDINGDTRYVIALSKNKNSASRIHFDVAHELGHILLHEWSENIEDLSPEEFREREQEANDFASAFLLPKDAYIKDVGAYADRLEYYIELKKKWKVSIAAMIRRSKNLELIDYDRYQLLMRKMQKLGIRKEEPLDDVLITAQPAILKTAVEMLLNEDVLTPKDFMVELSNEYDLSLYSSDIEELLDLKRGILKINNIIPIPKLTIKRNEDN